MTNPSPTETHSATLGGGCFWCLEAVYEGLQGVLKVQSGYSGGSVRNPAYREVCQGDTGHAEVVRVDFDPRQLSFREVLEVFFAIHDPTTLDRQGNDEGSQYRSVIFYHSPEQEKIARQLIQELEAEGIFDHPVVTELAALGPFYPAEEEHRSYYTRNSEQPYCRLVVAPKVAKFRSKFLSKLKQKS
jgi:peptide-methionine (S)-S-oxide reductase